MGSEGGKKGEEENFGTVGEKGFERDYWDFFKFYYNVFIKICINMISKFKY